MATREQVKYAMERLRSIKMQKQLKIRKDCTTEAPELKVKDVPALIKSGKIKPVKDHDDSTVTSYTNFWAVYDISEYLKNDVIDYKREKPRQEKLEAEFTKVSDELMLGDLKVALSLVEAFAKAKF